MLKNSTARHTNTKDKEEDDDDESKPDEKIQSIEDANLYKFRR